MVNAISTSDIRQAVLRDQFRLLYQPQIDIATGRLAGVEALLRWEHPRLGFLAPSAFLDAIGSYGLWNRVTGWVLDRAIADAAGWHAAGATIRVWVNVAASDVARHSSLPQQVSRALHDHGLPGDRLGLELTESGVLRNLDDAVSVLGSLRSAGVEIALDDFGTGFSSLTHLRRLPFSAVKIDRSFVQSIDSSAPDAAITGAVIDICRSLGVDSIVEGVERVAEWDVVARLGATQVQGYLLARPGPATHAPR
ncbi:MAG TPA: EAL domain-containing protein, partial [Ilumatobacter sp.]